MDAFLQDFGVLLRDYGLPLTMLVVFGALILSGRLRDGRQVDIERADDASRLAQERLSWRAEVDYREQLRLEEQKGRLAAEERLDRAIDSMDAQTDLLREISRDVLRGQRERSA